VSEVAILGAGNGGLATAADLGARGHNIRLYNRSRARIEKIQARGTVVARGAIGDVEVPVDATADLTRATEGAKVVVVVLPATAHAALAAELAHVLAAHSFIILNPGHMCGSLNLRRAFEREGASVPHLAELGTLTYVCRSHEPGSVHVYGRADQVPLAIVPKGDAGMAQVAQELFPNSRIVGNPVEAWLHDVNMILHPPGMILGASWIEASGGDFYFYSQGVTDAVGAVMGALDGERRTVGEAFGIGIPGLAEIMAALGTADEIAASEGRLGAAVRLGQANRSIKAPSSLDDRYLHEDVPYGLVPLVALARIGGVTTPVADALITIAGVVSGRDYRSEGLSSGKLGLVDADVPGLLRLAEGAA
jgi:opine dehydrogenase